jgi:hypothetical protein
MTGARRVLKIRSVLNRSILRYREQASGHETQQKQRRSPAGLTMLASIPAGWKAKLDAAVADVASKTEKGGLGHYRLPCEGDLHH